MKHYHSTWPTLDFQAEGVARLYMLYRRMVVWDTGLGKSHLAMMAAALLYEDEKISSVLVVAEQTKLDEWVDDFKKHTDLTVGLYHGSRRSRLLDPIGGPVVLVSTYETIRNDASHNEVHGRRQSKRRVEGPLTDHLMGEMAQTGKGVLVVYDESSKLRTRTSETYQSHDFLVKRLEKPGRDRIWIAHLTGTPIESGPENGFNEWRVLDRTYAPTVAQFEAAHVLFKDEYGKPTFKNIGEGDFMRIPGVETLADKMAYLIDRKRKSDPDVRDRFPRTVEDISPVSMTTAQKAIYDEVEVMLEDAGLTVAQQGALFMAMRQLVGHPEALLRSSAEGAVGLVEHFGADRLMAAGSGKLERLVDYLRPILAAGDQVAVYSFFGRSIIPLIARRLDEEGMSYITHTGAQTSTQKNEARRQFRLGRHRIFLSSDAGAKGINLPEASYIVNFELPLLYSTYYQRISRNSRLGESATDAIVTAKSLVVPHTVEARIAGVVYQRNEWHDMIVDADGNVDESHTKASDRILLRQIADAPRPKK